MGDNTISLTERDAMKRIKNRRGTTLVELMVTLALIGIFLVVSAAAVTNGLRVFVQVKTTANAIVVSDTILDKISGELTAARKRAAVSESQDAVAFYTRTGSLVSIRAKDGRMNMHYDPVTGSNGNGAVVYEAADWQFDQKMYQGLTLESLRFAVQSGSSSNVIQVAIQLRKGDFVYTDSRWVECTDPDMKAIAVVPSITDDPNSVFP